MHKTFRVWDSKEKRWLSTPDLSYVVDFHGTKMRVGIPEYPELQFSEYLGWTDSFNQEVAVGDVIHYTEITDDGEVPRSLIVDSPQVTFPQVLVKWGTKRIVGNRYEKPDLE